MRTHIRIVNERFQVVRIRQVVIEKGQYKEGIGTDGNTYRWASGRNIITYTTNNQLSDAQLILYAKEVTSYFHTHDKDLNDA